MKKIYILMAAIALLSMSLNAQQLTTIDRSQLKTAYTNPTTSFYNTLKSIKGMSGILPELNPNWSSSKGQSRAPLKINSDETTVGPFTGDYFDPNAGMGFGNAYNQAQMVLIEVDLDRSEYANYIGEDILGFRLALAGDGTQTVQVGEFIAWPSNSNGSWDTNNRYTWSLGELTSTVGDPYYEKVTSTSDLESGAEYLIVCENYNVAFNGSLTGTNIDGNNNYISVSPSNGIIASNATTDAATFTITANGNYYTIKNKSGYYIGRTQNSNGINYSTSTQYNNTITISNGNASIRCSASTARYLRYYNSTSDHRFRYYQTSTGQIVQLYKKVTPTAPAYVALQDGQWHEFYLDNPVTFNVGSDNAALSLGYTYIQYPTGTTGQNLFPIGINPQSTTHDHYAYLTTTTSGNGDIVITVPSYNTMFQTITVTDNNTGNTLTSWSSAETTVTDGTYTYYQMPSGWTLSGVYMFTYTTSGYTFGYLSSNSQSSITIDSSLLNGSTNVSVAISGAALDEGQSVDVNGDSRSLTSGYTFSQTWNPVDLSGGSSTSTGYNYFDFSQYGDLAVQLIFKNNNPPELTAPEDGSTVDVGTNTGSGVSTTITVSGNNLTEDLTVSVSGTGFSVSPTTISAADANAGTTITVTYDGTDPNATGTLTIGSNEVGATVVNLTASYEGGSEEPTYSTDGIIRMGNLIIVDQFWASTAENKHPEQYSYILRYTPNEGDPKESSPKTVDVEHTKSIVNGFYTKDDVDTDSTIYNTVIVNKLTADVEMTLPNNDNQIYYVRIQGKENDVPQEADKAKDNFDMLAKLQLTSGDGGFYYIDQIPASHPEHNPGEVFHFKDNDDPGTGTDSDFKTYVPSVMTYGYDRRYFADDTLHNTYGAPIWRTSVGKVDVQPGLKVLKQHDQWGSTEWSDGTDDCNLYILDNVQAHGYLPNPSISNVDYEAYMFRIFVVCSDNNGVGKLRGYDQQQTDYGWQLVHDGSFTNFTGPLCIFSDYVEDNTGRIRYVADEDYYEFILINPEEEEDWHGNQKNYAMFGGLGDIVTQNPDGTFSIDPNFKVLIRFYYRSKGSLNPNHVIRGMRDASTPPMYYGSEKEAPSYDPSTDVAEFYYHGEIESQIFYNVQGMASDRPFDGVNIVVTRFSDGTTTTTKVVR